MIIVTDSVSDDEIVSEGSWVTRDNPVIGWQNVVEFATVQADASDVLYPITNLANSSTAEKWVSSSISEQTITVVVPDYVPINYVALARHNLGSAGVTLSVEAYELDTWTEIVPPFVPANDDPLIVRFPEETYYAVRLRLVPSLIEPTIAVLYVGKLLTLLRRVYVGHVPITYGKRVDVVNSKSESGEFLGRIVLGQSSTSLMDLPNLPPAWYRDKMVPFIESAAEYPFFVAWRPNTYPSEVGYAWLTNDPRMENQRANGLVQTQLVMEGIA